MLCIMRCQPASSDSSEASESSVTQEAPLRSIEVFAGDTADLATVIDPAAPVEILAEGFIWTEGPVWISDQQLLLFSDVPQNTIFSWTEDGGVKTWLSPSGYTGEAERGGEPGSNGLALSRNGYYLFLCQHGDRRVARMEASLRDPKPVFITLADNWKGNRFNSPNDLVIDRHGQIFFTDPPYGLPDQEKDTSREIEFQGVFRRDTSAEVHLITDQLTRPNGIALSPDERTLYVANSDPGRALWMAYDLDEKGGKLTGRVFYDATSEVPTHKGLPDGLKVNRKGILFATGPGGVWIFTPEGKALGRINTGEATANCALNSDESMLYICADDYLMRVMLKV